MISAARVGLAPSRLAARQLPRTFVRSIKTESLAWKDAQIILNQQRLNRPSSPHMTIYRPQITWIASIFNRMTGAALSVGMYGFFLAYLASPILGWHLDTTHIVDFVHSLPEWAKYAGKTVLALPFAFHSLNGVRHLSWDLTKVLTNRAVIRTGWAVVAGTVVSTVALVLL